MAGKRGEYIYDSEGNIIDATGGLKTAMTINERYEDHFKKIGHLGGSVKGLKKGFAASHERAVAAGRAGGKVSRRGRSEANYKFKKGIEYDEKRT